MVVQNQSHRKVELKKKRKKVFSIAFISFLTGFTQIVFSGYCYSGQASTELLPLPEFNLVPSVDLIERGHYLVYGPAGCARCHTEREKQEQLDQGNEIPLIGGRHWSLVLGDIYAANLTGDKNTGLGEWSSTEIARAIRYGIGKKGEVLAPFMEYTDITDEDLQAIVAFLKSLPAENHVVPQNRWSMVGKIACWFLGPKQPSQPLRTSIERAATPEYGEYLANTLSQCVACHTQRSQLTGLFTGPQLGGGTLFPYELDENYNLVPPNITTAPRTGRLANLSEAQFIERMRAGSAVKGTHMPWGAFKRAEDNDLIAIYRYIKSVGPVEFETGPVLQPR